MLITVSIARVDGTDTGISVATPVDALDFIHKHDHEGATVTVTLTAQQEEAYRLLQALPKES